MLFILYNLLYRTDYQTRLGFLLFYSFNDSMQIAREMTWLVKYLPRKYENPSLLAPPNPRDKNYVLWCMHVSVHPGQAQTAEPYGSLAN